VFTNQKMNLFAFPESTNLPIFLEFQKQCQWNADKPIAILKKGCESEKLITGTYQSDNKGQYFCVFDFTVDETENVFKTETFLAHSFKFQKVMEELKFSKKFM
jgi:hypothetical protein